MQRAVPFKGDLCGAPGLYQICEEITFIGVKTFHEISLDEE